MANRKPHAGWWDLQLGQARDPYAPRAPALLGFRVSEDEAGQRTAYVEVVGEARCTARLVINDLTVASTDADDDPPGYYTLTAPLSLGTNALTVRLVDEAGNVGAPLSIGVVLQPGVLPPPIIMDPTEGEEVLTAQTHVLGTAGPGTITIDIEVNGETIVSGPVAGGHFDITIATPLAPAPPETPAVTAFVMPDTLENAREIPITTLTATGDAAEWIITINQDYLPQVEDPSWDAIPPASITVERVGTYVFRAYVRDVYGAVSAAFEQTVVVSDPFEMDELFNNNAVDPNLWETWTYNAGSVVETTYLACTHPNAANGTAGLLCKEAVEANRPFVLDIALSFPTIGDEPFWNVHCWALESQPGMNDNLDPAMVYIGAILDYGATNRWRTVTDGTLWANPTGYIAGQIVTYHIHSDGEMFTMRLYDDEMEPLGAEVTFPNIWGSTLLWFFIGTRADVKGGVQAVNIHRFHLRRE